MSSLRVTFLSNRTDDGPVEFSTGLSVASGYEINGDVVLNTTTGIVTATNLVVTNMNVVGVLTATSLIGNGSGMTSVPGTSNGKAVALGIIA